VAVSRARRSTALTRIRFLTASHNQIFSSREFRLFSIKRAKSPGLQENGRGNVKEIERAGSELCRAPGRNLRSLTENFAAEGLKFVDSGSNVISKKLQRSLNLLFA
jgi:hypothetical protein